MIVIQKGRMLHEMRTGTLLRSKSDSHGTDYFLVAKVAHLEKSCLVEKYCLVRLKDGEILHNEYFSSLEGVAIGCQQAGIEYCSYTLEISN